MDEVGERDATRGLAEFVAGLGYGHVSAADVTQLKGLVLDHLGVACAGATMPWGIALADWARTYAGAGACIVMGCDMRTPAPIAGMVNASAAHGLELDDTHDESITHPGAVVIATALAVGTERKSSGKELIAAIIAGYDVMARLGMATGAADVLERGFHPTALFGGFGAAAAAAKLYRLGAATLAEAWGLMLSMAGGSMQFSQDPHGTTVKRLHGGYGAHHGIIAAQLAALGIAGPAKAFDGVYGLCRMFGFNPQVARLDRAPDDPFEIHRVSLKPYPCCRLFHSTIDALGVVTDDFNVAPDDIEGITVGGPAVLVTQHMMKRPTSMMAAQYSLPYTLGASLADGPYAHEAFAPERLNDRAILAIGDRVEAVRDESMEKAFPKHYGSWVELRLKSGATRRKDVLDSYGTPANPMPPDAIAEKFKGLVAAASPALDAERAETLVSGLEELDDVSTLARQFGAPQPGEVR